MQKLAGNLKKEEEAYNLAVCLDTIGHALSFIDIATLEYHLNNTDVWKDHVVEQIHASIAQWAASKTTPQDIFRLGKFGADEKAINALKKTLKSLSTPL